MSDDRDVCLLFLEKAVREGKPHISVSAISRKYSQQRSQKYVEMMAK
jgi:hypothetical protein